MSDVTPADVANRTAGVAVAEPASDDSPQEFEQYPADHPLVRALESKKVQTAKLLEKLDKLKGVEAKAKRLDELEEASKSDAEKAADRIAKAEQLAQTVPAQVAESLKAHLVTLHEIDSEDAELFLTANEPELLLKQVQRLLDQTGKRRKNNHVPREGSNPPGEPTSDMRDFTRGLFGKAD